MSNLIFIKVFNKLQIFTISTICILTPVIFCLLFSVFWDRPILRMNTLTSARSLTAATATPFPAGLSLFAAAWVVFLRRFLDGKKAGYTSV